MAYVNNLSSIQINGEIKASEFNIGGEAIKSLGSDFYVDSSGELHFSGNTEPSDVPTGTIVTVSSLDELTSASTVYKFTGDVTSSDSVTIPENSILWFNGGSISGSCTLNGQNTKVVAGYEKIFGDGVTISGTWNCMAHPEWFGAVNDNIDYGSWNQVVYGSSTASTPTHQASSSDVVEDYQAYFNSDISGLTNFVSSGMVGTVHPESVVYCSADQHFYYYDGEKYYYSWGNSELWNDSVTNKARTDTMFVSMEDGLGNDKSHIFVESGDSVIKSSWRSLCTGSTAAFKKAIDMTGGNVQLKKDGVYAFFPADRVSVVSDNNTYTVSLGFSSLEDFTFDGNNATLLFIPLASNGMDGNTAIEMYKCNNSTFKNLKLRSVRESEGVPYGGSDSYNRLDLLSSGIGGIFATNCTDLHFDNIDCRNLCADFTLKQHSHGFNNNIYINGYKSRMSAAPLYTSTSRHTLVENADIEMMPLGSPGSHLVYHACESLSVYPNVLKIKKSRLVADSFCPVAINSNCSVTYAYNRHGVILEDCRCSVARLFGVAKGTYVEANNCNVTRDVALVPGNKLAGSISTPDAVFAVGMGKAYAKGTTFVCSDSQLFLGSSASKGVDAGSELILDGCTVKSDFSSTNSQVGVIVGCYVVELHNCGINTPNCRPLYNTYARKTIVDNCFITTSSSVAALGNISIQQIEITNNYVVYTASTAYLITNPFSNTSLGDAKVIGNQMSAGNICPSELQNDGFVRANYVKSGNTYVSDTLYSNINTLAKLTERVATLEGNITS